MKKRICIIGAGCSGITALKNVLQVGLTDVVCYEKSSVVGGNWAYSESNTHSSVCETTHIISSKKLSEYCDFPMPDSYPDYPSHEQVCAYFNAYVEHFKLRPYIRFNTSVSKAEKIDNERWRLTLSTGEVEEFDALLVANGHHNTPRHPNYPGDFTGNYLHSHDYKHNRDERFINKRVLVIGGGNSACDCAVEISRVASTVGISMRRGHYIIPKFFLGKPTDTFNGDMLWVPNFIAAPFRRLALWLQVGDYRMYGLEKPDHPLLMSHPTVNSELLYKIKHGKVHPRRDIERYEGKTVVFKDGTREDYDTIVASTGYKITTPFFDSAFLDFDYEKTDRVPLYLRVFHPEHKSLFFIGLVQPQGAIWPLSDAQSQVVANYLAGNWSLPNNVKELAEKDAERISKQFIKKAQHTIEVHFHEYLGELNKQIAAAKKTRPSASRI